MAENTPKHVVLCLFMLAICLLSACTLYITAPTPEPEPPHQEIAESLFRAFALQSMVKNVFMEGAQRAQANELSGGDAIGMMLLTAGLLQASNSHLQLDFPDMFQPYVERANAQGTAIAQVGRQWFDTRELATADVPATLDTIDVNGELERYTEFLLSLRYSHDDVEMMNVRLQNEIKERLASPLPTPTPYRIRR